MFFNTDTLTTCLRLIMCLCEVEMSHKGYCSVGYVAIHYAHNDYMVN